MPSFPPPLFRDVAFFRGVTRSIDVVRFASVRSARENASALRFVSAPGGAEVAEEERH